MRSLSFLLCLITATWVGHAQAQDATIAFGEEGHDSSQPIEITSDSLRVDQETGEATFIGNVIAIQGDMRLASNLLDVIYTENKTDVQYYVARGDVVLTSPTQIARSEEAIYEIAKSEVTMLKNVIVTQSGSAISGPRMVVDLTTNIGVMSGPVKAIFVPEASE